MGGASGCLEPGFQTLPEYDVEFGSSDLPAWVSAGGRALFDQAIGIASSDPGRDPTLAQFASYDGQRLTPDEQLAAQILRDGASSYKPFIDQAENVADTLGQGYDAATRESLMGDPYVGMTNEQLQGTYAGQDRSALLGDYTGATREELLGGAFNLEQAQPFLDIYQGAQDASIREVENQTLRNQMDARARAATGGSFGGSRLGIAEAMLGSEGVQTAADLRSRAAAEGLGFAANRFDTDRGARFDAENMLRGQFESDRGARFDAENVMRGQYESDRASRFDTEGMRRSQFDADRASRFGAEDSLRAGYQAEEASRLAQMQSFRDLAPLTQSLQEAAAQGLITSGEARRRLDQAAIDLANQQDQEDRFKDRESINFALGALQGVPYQTSTMGYRIGSDTAQTPSLFGQLLGAGGTAAAAYYAGRR